MFALENRVAVITGGGSGIGRAIARRYASERAQVVIADLDREKSEEVVQSLQREFGVGCHFLATDVREKDQVEAMVADTIDRFGRLDILVNNAWGGGTFRKGENKSDSEMEHGLAMNLWPGFWSMKAAFPHMKARQWGRIINMCSINGVNAYTGTLEYNVSKEALRALSRSLAREWAAHQICVNVICPSAITDSLAGLLEKSPDLAKAAPMPPMGRIGDPDSDIAGVALFLAGEDARYLTGNTLFVDGGTHINGGGWSVALPD
jgi:NAD(P)-dependent dehydrogenase (short-subunit alcohol dehydrogenase family)